MTLIERLEAGETGPELDGLIWSHLRPQGLRPPQSFWTEVSPALTTSVDAVKALQEEVLPGWYWMLDGSLAPERYEASLTNGSVPSDAVREDVNRFFGHAPAECNARLAALLRAYGEEASDG